MPYHSHHSHPHPSHSSHSSHPRSNSHSPKASGMVSADIDSARYPSYTSSPDHRHVSSSSHHKYVSAWNLRNLSRHIISRHHSHSSMTYDSRNNNGLPYYGGHSSSQLLHYPTSSRSNSYQPDQRSVQLFDPENTQRPHPSLMTHYINVFFEQHGAEFPFLSYQDVSTDFWDQRLSSILANCIAAMASQYVTINWSNSRDLTKEKNVQSSRVIDARVTQCFWKLHWRS